MTDYADRVASIRDHLTDLARTNATATLPGHVADQLGAAHHDTVTELRRLGAAEQLTNPTRWHYGSKTSTDLARVVDAQARVMAAMGDGRWRTCVHLRRTPHQPAYVLLPVRRVDCRRCLATARRPPADEADRCDLCGARDVTRFWPLRLAVASWLVLGDTCRTCARALANPAAA